MPGAIDELAYSSFLAAALLWVIASGLLLAVFGLGWYVTNRQGARSPFSGKPMIRGHDLTFEAVARLRTHLGKAPQPENPDFQWTHSVVCRETGRVFTDVVNRWGVARVSSNYLKRRYPGTYTPWTALQPSERQAVLARHPQGIGAYELDGLYVDLTTKTLLGWQRVPETGLQILIVNKPEPRVT